MRQPPEERIEKSQAGVERRLEEIAKDGEVREKVEKLVFFCGIDILSAVSIVSEVGDFNRFARARELPGNGLLCLMRDGKDFGESYPSCSEEATCLLRIE